MESMEKRRERGGGGGGGHGIEPEHVKPPSEKNKTNQGRANERLHLPDMKY